MAIRMLSKFHKPDTDDTDMIPQARLRSQIKTAAERLVAAEYVKKSLLIFGENIRHCDSAEKISMPCG